MIRLLVFLLGAAAVLAAAPPPCSLVPGWQQDGDVRHFTTDDLYEYMNGNSEGYFLYGFREMDGISCKSGEKTFVIDVSTMEDGEYAYGMFLANMDPSVKVEPIGTAGQIGPRKAVFAKGAYYVEIAANPEGDHSPALREFILAIEKRTEGATAKPGAIQWFPQEGLKEAVRLVPQSVLGIRLLARGYLGQYDAGKLFVVEEENPEAAQKLMVKLKERFDTAKAVSIADEAFQAEDRYLKGLCFVRKGKFVAGAASAENGEMAAGLAKPLVAKLP